MKNARLEIRLSPDLLQKIRAEADRRGMTVTKFITLSVENNLPLKLTKDESKFFNYEPDGKTYKICQSPND